MTAYERTGWRDEAISARHRRWGYNVPAVDLDFPLIEYDRGVCKAIIDYKHIKAHPMNGRTLDTTHTPHISPSFRALAGLGNRGPRGEHIPIGFYVVYYDIDNTELWNGTFHIYQLRNNKWESSQDINERTYVGWLHYVRRPPQVIAV